MSLEIDIGAKIKARRLSNQQTLKQLAEKVGCTSAYLSQIENGKVTFYSEPEEDFGSAPGQYHRFLHGSCS